MQDIKAFILDHVVEHPRDITKVTMAQFNVTRTTVQRHINALLAAGKLIKNGKTKAVIYARPDANKIIVNKALGDSFDESVVFETCLKPRLLDITSDESLDMANYAATEMLNNANDHAKASKVTIELTIDHENWTLSIQDNGIGIFAKLANHLDINSYHEVMLELNKGKLTTDPANHSGEGIFFTSRSIDQFWLSANGYCYMRDNKLSDWTFFKDSFTGGTQVRLKHALQSSKDLTTVFEMYQSDDHLAFDKTDIHVSLIEYGNSLISRSQAKRVLNRLENFKHVMLDFKDVRAVGQGFADEIFRVYRMKHPGVIFSYCNANTDVTFMIERAKLTESPKRI